ncbi:MAG: 30S ribosomal protein S8 [Minisyncoccia bacterium]
MVTDSVGDMLIRLKNASCVGHDRVSLPYSALRRSIADTLAREGYIGNVKEKAKPTRQLEIDLSYRADGRPAISGAKRLSKPSRRMYIGMREIRPVRRGYGLLVLSTPAGILSGKEAREKKVGGEALFEVW